MRITVINGNKNGENMQNSKIESGILRDIDLLKISENPQEKTHGGII